MKPALAFVCVLFVCMRSPADDAAVAKELKTLAGEWKLTAVEENGKAVPKSDILPITFICHADGKSDVRVGNEEFQTKATIDPIKAPKTIDIEYLGGLYKGQKQYGIYKIESDRWTVFSTPPNGDRKDRPLEFDSRKFKGAVLVWERVKQVNKK